MADRLWLRHHLLPARWRRLRAVRRSATALRVEIAGHESATAPIP